MTNGSLPEIEEAIVNAVRVARPGQVFSLIGPPAAGRRTLLRRLRTALADYSPVALDLPHADLDVTSVALANLEQEVASFRLSPGLGTMDDRLELLREALQSKDFGDKRVALVYVPWLRPTLDARPTSARMAEALEAVLSTLTSHCVTVLAAGRAWPAARWYQVLKFGGTKDWLEAEFPAHGDSLTRIMDAAPSRLELRLAYGMLEIGCAEEDVLNSLSARLPLENLVDSMWSTLQDPAIHAKMRMNILGVDRTAVLRAWKFLAVARTPVPPDWLDRSLGAQTSTHPLIRHALTYTDGGKLVLHERLRAPALKSLLEPGSLETWANLHEMHAARWLEEREKRLTEADPRTASADVHFVYHSIESGVDPENLTDRLWFQDQLCLLGRTLSKRHKRFEDAYACFRRAREIDQDDAYAWHYAGYNHAKMTHCEARIVEESYSRAVGLRPDQPWYHQRLVRWFLERGNPKRARQAWSLALSVGFPIVELDEPSLVYYRNLHWLVAKTALETGTLDFAAEVLRDIPEKMFELDANLAGCRTRLELLKLADASRLVRPWPVAQRLGPKALLVQPEMLAQLENDQPLTRWYAARVEDLDDRSVFLLMAGPPSPPTADPVFRHSEITRDVFDSLSRDERFDEMEPGRYLEIGEYGTKSMIRVFRLGTEVEEGLRVAAG